MRIILGSILALAASAAMATECKFTAERNLDIDSSGLKALALALGSSDAQVSGVAGLKRIEVRGKACASEESKLAGLSVEQHRAGDRVEVKVNQADNQVFSSMGSNYAYIDLTVRLPAELLVEVRSGSGDASVAGVAAVDFSAGSGDLKLSHISGSSVIKVGSGDVIADNLGSLEVERSGSGDIHATQINGEVKVGHIGSGDLTFGNVKGGVHIDAVGSGDVRVDHAGGDVRVGSIGSGDVNVDSVGGSFTVESAGSGDIHHSNVTGKVSVPERHEDD